MILNLSINGTPHEAECVPSESLFAVVRRLGYFGVKFGDEQGLTGADTLLVDGKPVNAGSMLAMQAVGHNIVTIEALGEHPDQGWKKTEGLHPLQRAFVESGAIQCGYCTPAQILAAKTLLDKNQQPIGSGSTGSPFRSAVPLHGVSETSTSRIARGGYAARR